MIEIVYTVGLPASGKTTFSKQWVQEDPKHRVRINRDDIRRMLGMYYKEELVTAIEDTCIITCLTKGYSIVIDGTNFRLDEESILEDVGTGIYGKNYLFSDSVYEEIKNKYKVTKVDFTHVPIEECIKRDKERKYSVGEEVIRKLAKKYLNYD